MKCIRRSNNLNSDRKSFKFVALRFRSRIIWKRFRHSNSINQMWRNGWKFCPPLWIFSGSWQFPLVNALSDMHDHGIFILRTLTPYPVEAQNIINAKFNVGILGKNLQVQPDQKKIRKVKWILEIMIIYFGRFQVHRYVYGSMLNRKYYVGHLKTIRIFPFSQFNKH